MVEARQTSQTMHVEDRTLRTRLQQAREAACVAAENVTNTQLLAERKRAEDAEGLVKSGQEHVWRMHQMVNQLKARWRCDIKFQAKNKAPSRVPGPAGNDVYTDPQIRCRKCGFLHNMDEVLAQTQGEA